MTTEWNTTERGQVLERDLALVVHRTANSSLGGHFNLSLSLCDSLSLSLPSLFALTLSILSFSLPLSDLATLSGELDGVL